jgi:hypothetical protein
MVDALLSRLSRQTSARQGIGVLARRVLEELANGALHGQLVASAWRTLPGRAVSAKFYWLTAQGMPDRNREAKYYRLTPAGKKRLSTEHSKWRQLAHAIARVMEPA